MTAVAELATRKLNHARAKAKTNIDLWNKAVEVAHEAERRAECWIQLPESLVKELVVACSQIETADYLTCIALDPLAIRATRDVRGFATRALEQEIKNRVIDVENANASINTAIAHRDKKINEAEAIRKSEHDRVASQPAELGIQRVILWFIPFLFFA